MNSAQTAILTLPATERQAYSRIAFGTPRAVWMATRADQVRACLDRVERAQQAGKYVVGLISYEAASAFDAAHAGHLPGALPLTWFAAFDAPVEYKAVQEPFTLGDPLPTTEKADYTSRVTQALQQIRAGNVYQVNYTIRAQCGFTGSPRGMFAALTQAVPVPHAAYVDTGPVQIVSLSPELFLQRRGNKLISKPMKGTAPRHPSWDADECARKALAHSEKDRAENIMIVDLMRNDLGRICQPGTVRVSELCKVERYPTVHQMISTVEGELRDGVGLFEIFAATFPPGSVTGAPKIRATEVIKELEPTPRGIYCGSIALFLPGGDFVCSIAIRTLEVQGNVVTLGIGSGIVADSVVEREWDEALLKAQFAGRRPQAFGLYEAFRWQPGVGFRNLHGHLRRLKHSCDYFARPFPMGEIKQVLRELKQTLGDAPTRIRLDVSGTAVSYQLLPEELGWPGRGVVVMIPGHQVDPADARLYHKTTIRPEKTLARERAKRLGADECLFLNTRGEFTEGSISSMIFKLRGEWLTPALSCGLLPGVWRDQQLHSGRVREGVIRSADLPEVEEIRIGNSVRGEARVIGVLLEDGTFVYQDRESVV